MPPMTKEERKARQREYRKAYYEANKEKVSAQGKAYYEANKEKKAVYHKTHYEANKEKVLEKQKAYREANKEKIAAYGRAYREANKEKKRARQKAYYEANKEKIAAYREANKEERAAYDKAYREANKEKVRAKNTRRAALKMKLIPKPLIDCPIEKDRILKIYKLRAIISKATGVEHHVDHMWPLSDGGPHWSGNLQIITAQENLSKNASVCDDIKAVIKESLEETLREYTCTQS